MPQHLDVLFLTHNYPRHDGDFAGRFLDRLARLLSVRGVKIGVLAPHHPGASEFEMLSGIPVWRFRYGSDVQETFAYRGDRGSGRLFAPRELLTTRRFFNAFRNNACRLIAETNPRVLHAHWWVPAGWVASGVVGERRLIFTLHGSDLRLLQTRPWMRPLAARVFRRAKIISTVSNWLADFLRATYPKLSERVQVAPMPPEDELFSGSVRPGIGSLPLILSVTRYTRQKRNDVMIDALALLRGQGLDFQCRLVGDGGSLRDECESRIGRHSLQSHVQMIPSMPQAQLADEYRRADVTVLPAVDEGFGLALVEAQLCGCPVIGARSGGITDIIADRETGLLVDPGDANDLAGAIRLALTNVPLRQRIASEGQASAHKRFSSAAIADRIVAWYQL